MSPFVFVPIERAIVNLIDNAGAFVQRSPVRRIWVTGRRNETDTERPIEIAVSDTGLGLSVVDRENIFRPRKTGRPEESTGLGLYLSRTLIESIGGKLECEERPRWGGARFVIRLPERVG